MLKSYRKLSPSKVIFVKKNGVLGTTLVPLSVMLKLDMDHDSDTIPMLKSYRKLAPSKVIY